MDSFKLLSSYGGTEAVREMQQKLNRKYGHLYEHFVCTDMNCYFRLK